MSTLAKDAPAPFLLVSLFRYTSTVMDLREVVAQPIECEGIQAIGRQIGTSALANVHQSCRKHVAACDILSIAIVQSKGSIISFRKVIRPFGQRVALRSLRGCFVEGDCNAARLATPAR